MYKRSIIQNVEHEKAKMHMIDYVPKGTREGMF